MIGDKNEFLRLLRTLISNYEVSAEEISLPGVIAAVQTYAEGKLAFPITASEWPQTFES